MKAILSGKWAPLLAVALVLVVSAPACRAGSVSKADKHAQKIEKKLSKYKAGTLLHLEFSDSSECTGTVNTLSDTSFSLNNSETNAKETHNYGDVTRVEKGTEYIGAGSTPKHRGHIF
jgi:hypothetical protein